MQAAIPIVILIVIVLAIVVGVVVGSSSLHRNRRAEVDEAPQESLRFAVPEGQDPAVVIAALRVGGYNAVPDEANTQGIEISCHSSRDRDREEVRALIAAAPIDPAGSSVVDAPPVRFADE